MLSVRDDGPLVAFVGQYGDNDCTGVLVAGLGVTRVRAIEASVPLVGQTDRQPFPGLWIEQFVVRAMIVRVTGAFARLRFEAQLCKHRLKQNLPAAGLIVLATLGQEAAPSGHQVSDA